MSVGASAIGGRLRAARVWPESVRAAVVPGGAFLASRLLVLVAGVVGVLTTNKHDGTSAARTLHALGPVGNALAGSVDRFDAPYYLAIAEHGFGPTSSGKLAFFPLYPLLIRGVSVFTGSPVIAGVIVSAASFLVALILLHRLTALELGARAADATVLVLAFAPLSFFFTAIYTESLFLVLSVATVLAARTGRWRLACALGALATLSRPTGLLLGVALVVMRVRSRGGLDRGLAGVLALPAALLGYLALLHADGYPWLGVFAAQHKWHRVTAGPITGVATALWSAIRGMARIAAGAPVYHPSLKGPFPQGAESIVLLVVLVVACVALVGCLRRLPLEYGAYAGAVILMCLSTPEIGQPLWSFDRFTLTIFPLWMAAGAWLARRRLVIPAVAAGALLLVFYTVQFSSWAFVA